jgi:hypothetical protein
MSAVGTAAEEMIGEIRRQVPFIKRGEAGYPDHERCVAIATTKVILKDAVAKRKKINSANIIRFLDLANLENRIVFKKWMT